MVILYQKPGLQCRYMRVCRRVFIQYYIILHNITQYFGQKWVLLNMTWYYTICAKKCQYYICWFDFMQLWMDKTDVLVFSDVDMECAPALIIIASNAAHFVWCTVSYCLMFFVICLFLTYLFFRMLIQLEWVWTV